MEGLRCEGARTYRMRCKVTAQGSTESINFCQRELEFALNAPC